MDDSYEHPSILEANSRKSISDDDLVDMIKTMLFFLDTEGTEPSKDEILSRLLVVRKQEYGQWAL